MKWVKELLRSIKRGDHGPAISGIMVDGVLYLTKTTKSGEVLAVAIVLETGRKFVVSKKGYEEFEL